VGVLVAGGMTLFLARGDFFRTENRTLPSDPMSGEISTKTPAEERNYQVLVGDWIRPDGGYVIRIRSVVPDGRVDAGYFNPRPINVSRAVASTEGGKVKFFIELQDKGYPGSTYTLSFNSENDMLAGIYYQAALGRSFEVVFVRKK
jgi:hypothetical protein